MIEPLKVELGTSPFHSRLNRSMTQSFLMTQRKASRGRVVKGFFGRHSEGELQRERACGIERLWSDFSEELKNPNPVSGADPSTLRGLFHPNASKVANLHCAAVSTILKLG